MIDPTNLKIPYTAYCQISCQLFLQMDWLKSQPGETGNNNKKQKEERMSFGYPNSNQNSQIVIRVGEKVYPITPLQESVMEYLQEYRAMDNMLNNQFSPEIKLGSFVENYHFERVLEIIDFFEAKLPNPVKVRSSSPAESIGQPMTQILSSFPYHDLKKVYLVAHCLKIQRLKRSIAAFFASKVHLTDHNEYNQKKKLYGIQKEISIYTTLEYKHLPFMNNYVSHKI